MSIWYAKESLYVPGEEHAAVLKGECVVVQEEFHEDGEDWADAVVNHRRLTVPMSMLLTSPDPTTPPSEALEGGVSGGPQLY